MFLLSLHSLHNKLNNFTTEREQRRARAKREKETPNENHTELSIHRALLDAVVIGSVAADDQWTSHTKKLLAFRRAPPCFMNTYSPQRMASVRTERRDENATDVKRSERRL